MSAHALFLLQRILLDDVSEVRPGSHSYGFVKTNSTDLDDEVREIY